jgi:hypothetical protein
MSRSEAIIAGSPRAESSTGGLNAKGCGNRGRSLAFVQTLPHGIYIAMNGRVFDGDSVRKNRSTGLFEELSER